MAWLCLAAAIVLELAGTMVLKLSNGMNQIQDSILMYSFYALSVLAFAFAVKKMDIGLAYAMLSGIGTAAVVTVGILYFNEPSDTVKLACIALIMVGVIGLNLFA